MNQNGYTMANASPASRVIITRPHHAIEFGKRTQKKGQYFYNKLRKLN